MMRTTDRARRSAAVLLAAGLFAIAGCAGDDPTLRPEPTVTTGVSFQHELYSVSFPAGWRETDRREDRIEEVVEYRNDAGDYFRVHIFDEGSAFGSGYAADATWRLRVTADRTGYEVVEKDPRCDPSGSAADFCTAGDGELQLYALTADEGATFVRGHAFQFEFGNERSEGADTAVFEAAIEAFRIK